MTTSNPSSAPLPAFLRQSKSEIKAKFVDLEWAQRERLLQGTQQPASPDASKTPSQWARLTGDAITSRNRYLNVEPYASNRVRLRVPEGLNDYINASHITLGNRRYIATQGPKDTSVAHFYRMLAEELKGQGRAVVVMLTQTHEAGKEKCFQYYPLSEASSPMELSEEDGWGAEVALESVEEDVQTRSEIRRMRLRVRQKMAGSAAGPGAEQNGETEEDGHGTAVRINGAESEGETQELEIHHLLFSGWPDFLIPEGDDRAALLNLIALSAKLNAPASPAQANGHTTPLLTDQSSPRIIHCSAGVGRSGTFIAMDYLMSLLEVGELDGVGEEKDPIAEVVDELRRQRMMMVQGESQFFFLYEVLREAMEARRGEGQEGG